MSNSNRRRRGPYTSDQGVDRISNLSDDLLFRILSHVSTKCAVMTTVLCKRWKDIWTLVPVLDFSEMPSSYERFVHEVLLRKNAVMIHKLSFRLLGHCDKFLDWTWFDTIIMKRQIQHIDLSSFYSPTMFIPDALFVCPKLVVLKLRDSFRITAPDSVHLPLLEIIHFRYLQLWDDVIQKLVLHSPALKELAVVECFLTREISICSLTLETLKFRGYSSKKNIDNRVFVETPNLKHLDLGGFIAQCDIGTLSSLSIANIHIPRKFGALNVLDMSWVGKVLKRISSVQTLSYTVGGGKMIHYSHLLPFPNLTRLEIRVDSCTMNILEGAPNLVSLVLWNAPMSSEWLAYLSKCSLESIEMKEFRGDKPQMDSATDILQKASALKVLKLHMHGAIEECKTDVYEELSKVSTSCQVVICTHCSPDT